MMSVIDLTHLLLKPLKQNAVFSFCLGKTTEFQTASLLKEIGRLVSNHD